MLPLELAVNVVTVVSTSCVLLQEPRFRHHRGRNEPHGQQQTDYPPGAAMEQHQLERPPTSQTFYPACLATVTATATVSCGAGDPHGGDALAMPYQQTMPAVSDQPVSSVHTMTPGAVQHKVTSVPSSQSTPYTSSQTLGPSDFDDMQSTFTAPPTPLVCGIPAEPGNNSMGQAVSYGGSTTDCENSRYFTPGLLLGVASTLGYDQNGSDAVNAAFSADVSRCLGTTHQEGGADHCRQQSSCANVASELEEALYPGGQSSAWHEFEYYSHSGGGIGHCGHNGQTGGLRQCEYTEAMGPSEYNLMPNIDAATASFPSFQNCTVSENSESLDCPNRQHFLTCSDMPSGHGTQQQKNSTIQTSCPIYDDFGHDSMWYESDIDEPCQQQLYPYQMPYQVGKDSNIDEVKEPTPRPGTTATGEQNAGQLRCDNGQFISTRQNLTREIDIARAEHEHEHVVGSKHRSRTPEADGFQHADRSDEPNRHSPPTLSTSSTSVPVNQQRLPQCQQRQQQQQQSQSCSQPQSVAPGHRDPLRGDRSSTATDSQPRPGKDDVFPHQQAPFSPPLSQSGQPPGRTAACQPTPQVPGPSSLVAESTTQNMLSSLATVLSSSPTPFPAFLRSDPCPNHSPRFASADSDAESAEGSGREAHLVSQDDSSPSPSSSATSLVDVEHLLSSGVTVAGFKPRPIIRKRRKVMIPLTEKDVDYWRKRRKNNDSAKRSREAKKEKEKNFYRRALELEYENYFLKERLGHVEAQLHAATGVAPAPHDYGGAPPAPHEYGGAPTPHEYGGGAPPVPPQEYGTSAPQEYGGTPTPHEYGTPTPHDHGGPTLHEYYGPPSNRHDLVTVNSNWV